MWRVGSSLCVAQWLIVVLMLIHTAAALAGGDSLKVLSLNLAHGRGESFNQLLLGSQTLRDNLVRSAALLKREQPDVVAVQEADGPSRWSGSFDHVAELAAVADYPFSFRGSHARSWLFDYGTAILSRWPFQQTLSHAFAPSPPTAGKGFVLAQMNWPDSQQPVDVLSLHLDFSRDSVRQAQIDELLRVLAQRSNPLIVAGDFNTGWEAADSPLRRLASAAQLRAWQPQASDLGSYGDHRLDWILISEELRFDDYRVLRDTVSDHRAVIAVISRRP